MTALITLFLYMTPQLLLAAKSGVPEGGRAYVRATIRRSPYRAIRWNLRSIGYGKENRRTPQAYRLLARTVPFFERLRLYESPPSVESSSLQIACDALLIRTSNDEFKMGNSCEIPRLIIFFRVFFQQFRNFGIWQWKP